MRSYAPGSPERAELKARLKAMAAERIDIPLVIGGREVRTGDTAHGGDAPRPRATCWPTGTRRRAEHVEQAIAAAAEAQREWSSWRWEDRAAVFLKAAELLATTWRSTLNAATMLGQSKTAFQAEIDSACEMIDFWRFNPHYAQELYDEQPLSDHGDVEPAGLPAARGLRLRGHALQLHRHRRQPAHRARAHGQHGGLEAGLHRDALARYYIMKLLEAAGLPPGVINFVPGDAAADLRRRCSTIRDLAGVHFTGCTGVFNSMWKTIGDEHVALPLATRASWARRAARTSSSPTPRPTPQALAVAIVRGGFEYQGQKCSAASRVYVPALALERRARPHGRHDAGRSRWATCADFRNFMGAVIDRKAFDKHRRVHGRREEEREGRVRAARREGEQGYFIEPTLVETDDPGYRLLCEEIFGPVVTAYVYDDAQWEETLRTRGRDLALRAHGRRLRARTARAVREAAGALRNAAGNFYINDKPTGAVVGPAALRRRARLGHQRQGGLEAEPRALGQRAHDQGDLRAAARLPLPVHGGGVAPAGCGSSS